MKRYFFISAIILLVATAFTATLRTTVGYIWSVEVVKNCDRIVNSNGNNDTLTGNDTSYILTRISPEAGYNYFIQSPTWAGGSRDTAVMQVIVKSYNQNGSLLSRVAQDTLTLTGEVVPLNFNMSNDAVFSNFGASFSVMLKNIKTGTAQVVIGPQAASSSNYIVLRRAKPVTYNSVK